MATIKIMADHSEHLARESYADFLNDVSEQIRKRTIEILESGDIIGLADRGLLSKLEANLKKADALSAASYQFRPARRVSL